MSELCKSLHCKYEVFDECVIVYSLHIYIKINWIWKYRFYE